MDLLQSLWAYHDACSNIARVEAELASTEAHKKFVALHAELTELQNKKNKLVNILESSNLALHTLENEYADLERKIPIEITELEKRQSMEDVTSSNIIAIKNSLEDLLRDIKTLKAKIIKLAENIIIAQNQLQETLSRGTKVLRAYNKISSICKEEADARAPEIKKLHEIKAQCAAKVPPELVRKYDRVRGMHADPLAALNENKCSGCNMSLPTSTVQIIEEGNSIVTCENCGRILYCN
ncbi:MAG TPA: hypothetical protein GXZ61_05850 [Clostridiales bacterium]|jgi:predicted  nucleic acid-binding Zn-ribbon protein|nr:hypothetical protein [Clostridiales bacterium]